MTGFWLNGSPEGAGGPGLSPSLARANVRAWLAGEGIDAEAGAEVLMVVSELVANADEHGGGCTHLAVSVGGGRAARVTVAVGDRSPLPPVPRDDREDVLSERGRGWNIVRRLASRVDASSSPGGGKVVRAEVAVPLPRPVRARRPDRQVVG
ncbi:ATP-binding protein [Streptomyces hydrogenans]|uniref:ATP-binding protein n=1 Tax=Streptomyces hydrogenans TaxID=1873719 RepID=UPI0036B83F57